MVTQSLIDFFMEVASANPEGFTVTVPDGKPVRKGWCIGHKATQNSFGREGLQRALEFATENKLALGGWKDGDNYYFDAVIITHSEEDAVRLKVEHGQIAVYHIETGTIK